MCQDGAESTKAYLMLERLSQQTLELDKEFTKVHANYQELTIKEAGVFITLAFLVSVIFHSPLFFAYIAYRATSMCWSTTSFYETRYKKFKNLKKITNKTHRPAEFITSAHPLYKKGMNVSRELNELYWRRLSLGIMNYLYIMSPIFQEFFLAFIGASLAVEGLKFVPK